MQKAIQLLKKDPVLKDILHNPINVPYYDGDVNAYLYSSIISQQLSLKAAASIYNRFLNQFEGSSPDPDTLLNTDNTTLRSLGLSNAKTKYIKNVAQYFIDNLQNDESWQKLSNQEIIDQLTSIKGVGIWTVQMVLIFCLARKDVFPYLDLAIRASVIELYMVEGDKKEVKKSILEIAEHWKPYRSIASLYLWSWRNHREKNE